MNFVITALQCFTARSTHPWQVCVTRHKQWFNRHLHSEPHLALIHWCKNCLSWCQPEESFSGAHPTDRLLTWGHHSSNTRSPTPAPNVFHCDTLPIMSSKQRHWLTQAVSHHYVQHSSECSDDERNDGFASTWIILKLRTVRLVFAQRPLSHLSKADKCKDQC